MPQWTAECYLSITAYEYKKTCYRVIVENAVF